MKIGFIYAGQGSQVVGMGKSFYDHYEIARKIFDEGNPEIKKLCFEGPIEELSLTKNTQPAMVTVATIATTLLKEKGIHPSYVCGLSLGEYSSLHAAGVLDTRTTIDLVRFRGEAMEKASLGIESLMIAIIGLDREILQTVCDEFSQIGVVSIANYNCPGQLVIGGEKEAVEKAAKLALEKGARRAIPLKTSGPFHTKLLKKAANLLHEEFQNISFQSMKVPVIFNCTASVLKENETIPALLENQVMSSVYFEDSIRYMIGQGVDTIIEIGPGKVLTGFVRKIDKTVKTLQVEDYESLEAVIQELRG